MNNRTINNTNTKLIYLGNRMCVDLNKITCTCVDTNAGKVKVYYTCGSSEQSINISAEVFDNYLLPYITQLNK